jgi:uncharacterized protein (DUF433 family)
MVMVMNLKETAAVAAVSPKVIQHCLHAAVVKPARKAGHWRFTAEDALFFAIRNAIPFDIDLADQRALYALLAGHKKTTPAGWRLVDPDTLELGKNLLRVSLDFRSIRRELDRRLELLRKRETRIVSNIETLGGEPVFAGTRVSVRHVGLLMLRGVPMKEMREDFPRLKEEDFELAKLLAMIGPKPGRPRRLPPLRFLRNGKEVT